MVSWPRATRLRRAVPKVLAGLVIESFVPTKAAATVRNIFDRCGVLYSASREAARKPHRLVWQVAMGELQPGMQFERSLLRHNRLSTVSFGSSFCPPCACVSKGARV